MSRKIKNFVVITNTVDLISRAIGATTKKQIETFYTE
jgi:translation initiation factor 2 gamma subunit (eIF-2gamma)